MRGDRLKKRREELGLSQQELGDRIGMAYQAISRYETNRADPSAETLARIATSLEVSTDYLLGLVDAPTARLQEADLSPAERKLIHALRQGVESELLELLLQYRRAAEERAGKERT